VARELEVVARCAATCRESIQYSSSLPRGVRLLEYWCWRREKSQVLVGINRGGGGGNSEINNVSCLLYIFEKLQRTAEAVHHNLG
jgi:hypothetical protein